MKFAATLLLALTVLVPFYFLSNGTFYLSDSSLSGLAFDKNSAAAQYVTHLLSHVGLAHLLGNILPLIAFGLVLEQIVGSLSVIALFLASGIISSVVFAVLNPAVVLVGASTGVAGLMAATTLVKPKRALVLLLLIPIVLLLVPPAASFFNSIQLNSLELQNSSLSQQVAILTIQNKTQEAARANQTLQKVQIVFQETKKGIEREKVTPTDTLVHMLGAVLGALFVLAFHRQAVRKGLNDFESMGRSMRELEEKLLKKRK